MSGMNLPRTNLKLAMLMALAAGISPVMPLPRTVDPVPAIRRFKPRTPGGSRGNPSGRTYPHSSKRQRERERRHQERDRERQAARLQRAEVECIRCSRMGFDGDDPCPICDGHGYYYGPIGLSRDGRIHRIDTLLVRGISRRGRPIYLGSA